MALMWECGRCGEQFIGSNDPCKCPKSWGTRPLILRRVPAPLSRRPKPIPAEPPRHFGWDMTRFGATLFAGGVICGAAMCGCVRLLRLLIEVV